MTLKICQCHRSPSTTLKSDAIWWRVPTSIKVIALIFVVLALTVSEIFGFQMFDLENLGQGHGVEHSQRSHQMGNIKVEISLALTVFQILAFQIFLTVKNKVKIDEAQHSQWRLSIANT